MKALLDTNVVLDVLLQRGDWLSDAQMIWDAATAGRLECCLSASSLTDVFYVARKSLGWEGARSVIRQCLDTLSILAVDYSIVDHAYHRPESDYEDALVMSIAEIHGVDVIVTRDMDGFVQSPVEVMSPTQLSGRPDMLEAE